MRSDKKSKVSSASFLREAGRLAEEFSWPAKTFERGSEVVLVAKTATDVSFDRFVWVYDTSGPLLRCLLVSSATVSSSSMPAILELCARMNQGLLIGCAEYMFDEQVVVFRASADLDWGPMDQVVKRTTSRVLGLGSRYAPAIKATLEGTKPQDAVKDAEAR